MKTIFVVNPNAGQGKKFGRIIDEINGICQKSESDVGVYVTKASNDAKLFVNEYCKTVGPARFIACGGDGTFSEVLNGALEFDDVEIGIVPIGTGNDFCRNFSSDACFFDLEKQISGECVKCDAIRYTTNMDNRIKSGYCANMFNIGFDCDVADMTNNIKERTFLGGPLAYVVSIFVNLFNKRPANLEIEIDGSVVHKGELLLTSIANGSYCGGGLKTNPIAQVSDGFININMVKNISLPRLLKLLPKYINGSYLKIKNIGEIASSQKCKKVKITSSENKMKFSVDGEITETGITEFEVIPGAFRFVVPAYSKSIKHAECIVGL